MKESLRGFGDHFGHYSEAGDYPIFNINNVYARKDAIYPATVVGKPPQEDKYLGDCTQSILKLLIKVYILKFTIYGHIMKLIS